MRRESARTVGLVENLVIIFRRIKKATITIFIPPLSFSAVSQGARIKTLKHVIGMNLANAIVEYRNQHGAFHSLDDLKNIVLMDDETFGKLVHYLSL